MQLQPSDCFLILASDGVWEFISSAEAVEIVRPFFEAEEPPDKSSKSQDPAERRRRGRAAGRGGAPRRPAGGRRARQLNCMLCGVCAFNAAISWAARSSCST